MKKIWWCRWYGIISSSVGNSWVWWLTKECFILMEKCNLFKTHAYLCPSFSCVVCNTPSCYQSEDRRRLENSGIEERIREKSQSILCIHPSQTTPAQQQQHHIKNLWTENCFCSLATLERERESRTWHSKKTCWLGFLPFLFYFFSQVSIIIIVVKPQSQQQRTNIMHACLAW